MPQSVYQRTGSDPGVWLHVDLPALETRLFEWDYTQNAAHGGLGRFQWVIDAKPPGAIRDREQIRCPGNRSSFRGEHQKAVEAGSKRGLAALEHIERLGYAPEMYHGVRHPVDA